MPSSVVWITPFGGNPLCRIAGGLIVPLSQISFDGIVVSKTYKPKLSKKSLETADAI